MSDLSKNETGFLLDLLKSGLRFDGRGLLDHRSITINFGYSLGTVELALGGTRVLTSVSAQLEDPRADRPNEGFLKFGIDLSIMENDKQANSIYQPKKYSNEIARIIERIIKGSKALDIESLCLISGKVVWSIYVQITLLNNDGNLIDACYLATIIALLHFKKPYAHIEDQTTVVLDKEKLQPLSIHHIPIAITYAFFNKSKIVVMDPIKIEEEIMDGRLSFAVNIYRDICLIHKPGGAGLSPDLFDKLFDVCLVKVNQLTKIIRDVLKNSDKYSIELIKKSSAVKFMIKSETEEEITLLQIENMKVEDGIEEEDDINMSELKNTLDTNESNRMKVEN